MKKSVNGSQNKPRRYVLISSGPALGGKGVKVRIRELFTLTETVVSFAQYKKLEHAGNIETPAFIPKEKR